MRQIQQRVRWARVSMFARSGDESIAGNGLGGKDTGRRRKPAGQDLRGFSGATRLDSFALMPRAIFQFRAPAGGIYQQIPARRRQRSARDFAGRKLCELFKDYPYG